MTQAQLFAEALALDADARARLAEKLVASLPAGATDEIDAAWLEEARDRDAAFGRGEIDASPLQEVLARISSGTTK